MPTKIACFARPAVLLALLSIGCVGERSLDSVTTCPCAPHWTCDTAQMICTHDADDFGDPTADPNCAASPASYEPYADEVQLEALLIRRWKRCIAPQVPGEDVGVEFTADGRWYPLTRDGAGNIVRRTGVDFGGMWNYLPPGSILPFSGQPTADGAFVIDEVYTSPPQFTNDPRQLRILFTPVLGKYLPIDP